MDFNFGCNLSTGLTSVDCSTVGSCSTDELEDFEHELLNCETISCASEGTATMVRVREGYLNKAQEEIKRYVCRDSCTELMNILTSPEPVIFDDIKQAVEVELPNTSYDTATTESSSVYTDDTVNIMRYMEQKFTENRNNEYNIFADIIADCEADNTMNEGNHNRTSLFYQIASDKYGSQFIQEQIDCVTSPSSNFMYEYKRQLISRLEQVIKHDVISLSCNGYANYVVQKFLDLDDLHVTNQTNLKTNLRTNYADYLIISNDMDTNIFGYLALNKSGCRVLQKLLVQDFDFSKRTSRNSSNSNRNKGKGKDCNCVEKNKTESYIKNTMSSCISFEQLNSMSVCDKILLGIRNSFDDCIVHPNGIHVIQKLIDTLTHHNQSHKLQFMIDSLQCRVAEYACQKYACRVLQKLWQCCPNKMCADLFEEIVNDRNGCVHLGVHEYGNYVLQNLLFNCDDNHKFYADRLIAVVSRHFVRLSNHKYGSNLAEAVFAFGNEKQKDLILKALLVKNNGHAMCQMIDDSFGNYVAQNIIDILLNDHKRNKRTFLRKKYKKWFQKLLPRLENSRKCRKFGRNVISAIECL